MKKISYLGPRGTFTEEALFSFYKDAGEITAEPLGTIVEVIKSIDRGDTDEGLIPIENSLEGSVNITQDILAFESEAKIIREITIPIRHYLIGKKDTGLKKVRKVISHPHATAQCRSFLNNRLPGAEIIAANSTAEAVKKLVNIPVVSIEIRFIDFLDAIYRARQYGDRIGLVTYMTEDIKDLERVKTILDIDFQVFPYRTKEEMKKQIEDATALGNLTLIGMGDCILETAKVKNLNGVVIQTGEKQVKEAIIAAKNIYRLGLREKEKAERFKTILDHSRDGIIALDKNDVITIFNPAAEKIFDLSADLVLNRSIKNNINRKHFCNIYGDGKHQLNKLVKVNNKQIVLNRLPIIVGNEQRGLVMTFQEISQLQKLEQKVRTELYKKGLVAKYSFDDIIGESKIIKDTINQAKKIGKTSTTILIAGETGTGKELFAQSIHNISPRKDGPFVAINCAALPENLLESELFGYEEGAFTGAKKGGKIGMFELAHGGTIFLDEVGEIPLSLQGRLLRVLQEREVLRVGGDYILNVDIRVIAATNVDLYEKVKEGKFREDLYFRLNILDLRLPSLRERKEDIPLLVMNFIEEMNALGIPDVNITKEASVKCGIRGTHISVTVGGIEEVTDIPHEHGHHHEH